MGVEDEFIALQDHEENFQSNSKCRLINPKKNELGKVSKVILCFAVTKGMSGRLAEKKNLQEKIERKRLARKD